jgi:hypothetical protein
MRIPRGLPSYPYGDNEKQHFVDSNDIGIYWDGTDFKIDPAVGETLKINFVANTTKIYLGDSANDTGFVYANSSDAYPNIQMWGGHGSYYRVKAGYAHNFREDDTDFFVLNRSGSVYTTDAGATDAFLLSYSTLTTTGNITGFKLDVNTNITVGTNFGVIALKAYAAAPNGSGKSYAIDTSGSDAGITGHIKFGTIGSAITNPGTLSAEVPVEYNGTVYYVELFTAGS